MQWLILFLYQVTFWIGYSRLHLLVASGWMSQGLATVMAAPLIDYFIKCLKELGVPTQSGEFGAHMLVDIANDGPVTILLEN